jgi:hypothetical protein
MGKAVRALIIQRSITGVAMVGMCAFDRCLMRSSRYATKVIYCQAGFRLYEERAQFSHLLSRRSDDSNDASHTATVAGGIPSALRTE